MARVVGHRRDASPTRAGSLVPSRVAVNRNGRDREAAKSAKEYQRRSPVDRRWRISRSKPGAVAMMFLASPEESTRRRRPRLDRLTLFVAQARYLDGPNVHVQARGGGIVNPGQTCFTPDFVGWVCAASAAEPTLRVAREQAGYHAKHGPGLCPGCPTILSKLSPDRAKPALDGARHALRNEPEPGRRYRASRTREFRKWSRSRRATRSQISTRWASCAVP